jgi:hypothetical protein
MFNSTPEIQGLGLTLDFWSRIEHFLLMNTVNPVHFYPRNPGLNLDPGCTNSLRIAPQDTEKYVSSFLIKKKYDNCVQCALCAVTKDTGGRNSILLSVCHRYT